MVLPRVSAARKKRAAEIFRALEARYPDAHCELVYRNPYELLVATILSAQATDVSVNKATPALFKAFPNPAAYVDVTPGDIEPFVRSIGLFRNKSKSIVGAMKRINEEFGGRVPETMGELLTLPGVARKTANVVLGNAFGINEGVVVDTHVERLSKRFGLAPERATIPMVERCLMALFPREQWCMLSHLLIFHGRRVCKARGGTCAEDPICRKFCSNAKKARSTPKAVRQPATRSGQTAKKKAQPRAGRRTGRSKSGT